MKWIVYLCMTMFLINNVRADTTFFDDQDEFFIIDFLNLPHLRLAEEYVYGSNVVSSCKHSGGSCILNKSCCSNICYNGFCVLSKDFLNVEEEKKENKTKEKKKEKEEEKEEEEKMVGESKGFLWKILVIMFFLFFIFSKDESN